MGKTFEFIYSHKVFSAVEVIQMVSNLTSFIVKSELIPKSGENWIIDLMDYAENPPEQLTMILEYWIGKDNNADYRKTFLKAFYFELVT